MSIIQFLYKPNFQYIYQPTQEMKPEDKSDDSENDSNTSPESTPISEPQELISDTESSQSTKDNPKKDITQKNPQINNSKYMNISDAIDIGQLGLNIVGIGIAFGLFVITMITLIYTVSVSERNYSLSRQNSEVQIDAMKEQLRLMKEQFEIENKPFLSVVGAGVEQLEVGKPTIYKIYVKNIGKYPVKITWYNLIVDVRAGQPAYEKFKFLNEPKEINIYMVGDYALDLMFTNITKLEQTTFNAIVHPERNPSNHRSDIYVKLEIDYINQMNDKKGKLFSYHRFQYIEGRGLIGGAIRNENVYIP